MGVASRDVVAVDLFCGAAGLSFGLQQSGIKIAAGVDLDPACRYPFEENIGAPFVKADVSGLSGGNVDAHFAGAPIRLLAGCAPCQPFSGYTTRRRSIDGRWQLLLDYLRVVEAVRPEIVTMENVPRLAQMPIWQLFVARLHAAGYNVAWQVLDASDYGVPQSRRRLVLLGSRLGPISIAPPISGGRKTVRSAIGKQTPIEAGKRSTFDPLHAARALTAPNLRRIRASRQGGTWRDWPEEIRVACHSTVAGRTYPSVYGRMSWDKPAPTITTQFYGFGNGRFGHPEQDRAITLREGAILQSFPSGFEFVEANTHLNFRALGRLIGNAVPPALARAIGSMIVEHVDQASR